MLIPGGLSNPTADEAEGTIGDVEAAHQLLANDMLDTSNELLREVEVLEHDEMDIYGEEEDG
jgi:hypothetical protein